MTFHTHSDLSLSFFFLLFVFSGRSLCFNRHNLLFWSHLCFSVDHFAITTFCLWFSPAPSDRTRGLEIALRLSRIPMELWKSTTVWLSLDQGDLTFILGWFRSTLHILGAEQAGPDSPKDGPNVHYEWSEEVRLLHHYQGTFHNQNEP